MVGNKVYALRGFPEFEFITNELEVSPTINNNSVDIIVEYPLEAIAGENQYSLFYPYETTIEANLGWILTISNNIVNNHIENDEINFNFLLDQGLSNIKYSYYNNETIIYILEDATSFNGEENYTFMFIEYYQ